MACGETEPGGPWYQFALERREDGAREPASRGAGLGRGLARAHDHLARQEVGAVAAIDAVGAISPDCRVVAEVSDSTGTPGS